MLEWMQLEEHDFLCNRQRTEYRYPDEKEGQVRGERCEYQLDPPRTEIRC